MTDHILKLEQQVMQAQAKQIRAEDEASRLKSKMAKQRNEIARLTELVLQLQAEKEILASEIKWMRSLWLLQRGETS
jgi:hypothetical protein